MKLLIRNLPRSTTAEELREMFEVYGQVQSCDLVMDKETGASKGFGFVEIPKIGNAKAAIKNLNGHRLDGNPIRVKKAEDRPATPKAETEEEAQPKSPAKPALNASAWK